MAEINEKKLTNYPKPVFIEGTEIILNQMKKTICRISTENGSKGTGFFCKIPYPRKSLKVFITNNHLIDQKYLNEEKEINIRINNKPKKIKLKDKFKYTSEEYDVTIVEIKENIDEIKDFLELDENSVLVDYFGNSIYTLQYPSYNEVQKPAVSYGILKGRYEDREYDFIHYCSTEQGSSGSPILNLSNNKIIGIHKQARIGGQYNIGVFLDDIIADYIFKYINRKNQITDSFQPKELSKTFSNKRKNTLDSINSIKIKYKINKLKQIRLFGDRFVETNKGNCKVIIDKNEKQIFSWLDIDKNDINREFIEITLKGIKNVTNMSHIFNGCSTLVSLPDISEWDTKNVKDMSYAFYGCSSIEVFPDISNWNTDNVTDIESIFSYCQSLKSLPDISKWNTEKVTNMSYVFYGCSALTSIPDISKWDTSKVTNLNNFFSHCSSITDLPNISKWNTENLVSMRYIFSGCTKLKSLPDLSKWDTKKVTDMNSVFSGCSSIKSLPDISKWNTSNVIEMRSMFSYCSSLESLPDISKWNIEKVDNRNYMFLNCNKLKDIPSKFL